MSKSTTETEVKPLEVPAPEAPKETGVPVVEPKETGVPTVGSAPTEYSGVYINNADGEPYGLAVVEDEPHGKTHFAKNSLHFWNGTKQEFKEQFEKK